MFSCVRGNLAEGRKGTATVRGRRVSLPGGEGKKAVKKGRCVLEPKNDRKASSGAGRGRATATTVGGQESEKSPF